jgi:hypothetical protein
MEYEARWYLCDLQDSSITDEEPDWSKVPADKRERVRRAWLAKQKPYAERVDLWGPQIPFFEKMPYYRVFVLESMFR